MTDQLLTAEDLDRIEAYCAAATPGPWTYSVDRETRRPATLYRDNNDEHDEVDIANFDLEWTDSYQAEALANATLCSDARADLPRAVATIRDRDAEIERLNEENRRLRERIAALVC